MSELLRYYLGKDTNIWNTRDGDFAATAPEPFIYNKLKKLTYYEKRLAK